MLYQDCIEQLTGLKDFYVKEVKDVYGELHIYGRMAKRIHKCPKCGNHTSRVHDYRTQIIKDVSGFGQITYLHLDKRRHVCPECGKRFYESVDFLPRYHRMTNRLIQAMIREFGSVQSISQIARKSNVSPPTVARIFDYVSFAKPTLPKVLSIDEFKGNAGGERFQCILTDPERKKALDVLPNRKSEDLHRYFLQFGNRKEVSYVVMDMSSLFKSVARSCFPNAKIVADRFHVTRYVCWAMDKVRKEEQKKFGTGRRKYFKHSKGLLLKHIEDLKPDQVDQLEAMLKVSERIRRAYFALQDFYKVMAEPNRTSAKKHLAAWVMRVQSYDLPEFESCVTMILNWLDEILNAFDVPFSNGYTEGVNNKIKVLKRVSYGVQDFERFRNRILMAMGN